MFNQATTSQEPMSGRSEISYAPSPRATSLLETYRALDETAQLAYLKRAGLYLARHVMRRDPARFASYVFDWNLTEFHRDWYRLAHSDAPDRVIVKAPVEHGKTATFALAIPLWLIGRDHETTGAIISSTATQAEQHLTTIESLIESDAPASRRLRVVFPKLRRESRRGRAALWTDSAMLIEREGISKDPTIVATGIEGPVAGRRWDWCVFDDPCDPRSMSEAHRRRISRWFWGVVEARLLDGGRIFLIGTPWHPDDILGEAEERGFYALTYRAEMLPSDTGNPKHLLASWPERWGEERLEDKRARLPGHEFDRQFLCLASSESSRFFSPDDIAAAFDAGRGLTLLESLNGDRADWRIYNGVDLATGEEGRDRTVMFVVGLRPDGIRRVLHLRAGRWGQIEILRNLLDVERQFAPDVHAVESNAQQRYVIQASRDRQIMAALGAEPNELARLRIMPTQTTGASKTDPILGIKGMSMDFEARKWQVPDAPLTRQWASEMERWTPDSHTGDILSAAYQAEQAIRRMRTPIVVRV